MEANQTSGAEILLEAHKLITGPRQASYSHPAEDYARTVSIFNAITGHNLTALDGILFMVSVKLSRLAHERATGVPHPDNIVDLAGYIGCYKMVETAFNVGYRFKTGESHGPA